MKKSIKVTGALLLVALMLIALTACGRSSNRVVATRDNDEMGLGFSERVEVTFVNDRVDKVVNTYEFEDEESAEMFYMLMGMGIPEEYIEMDGTTVTMTLRSEDFAEEGEEGATREEVIRDLEEDGFTIQ